MTEQNEHLSMADVFGILAVLAILIYSYHMVHEIGEKSGSHRLREQMGECVEATKHPTAVRDCYLCVTGHGDGWAKCVEDIVEYKQIGRNSWRAAKPCCA